MTYQNSFHARFWKEVIRRPRNRQGRTFTRSRLEARALVFWTPGGALKNDRYNPQQPDPANQPFARPAEPFPIAWVSDALTKKCPPIGKRREAFFHPLRLWIFNIQI
jgi:hypothetical protein